MIYDFTTSSPAVSITILFNFFKIRKKCYLCFCCISLTVNLKDILMCSLELFIILYLRTSHALRTETFYYIRCKYFFSKLLFTFSFSLWYSSPNRSETFEMEIFININFIISTFDFMLRKALLTSRTYKYKKIFSQ